ncbi:MAG: ACT domain-containing protein [Candidatus Altiarchaeota archaeon]|nr:ACT domain-containing protein [Candidatus Altiarchaeota archaeon]
MMKVDTILRMKDVPGMLVKALEPISGHGGNIISVTHSRSEKNLVAVHVSFRVRDHSSLDLIRKALARQRVHVSEIEIEGKRYHTKKSLSFILIGHVIDTDIQDTIDRINEIGMVYSIEVVMPSPKKESSVMLEVEVDGKRKDALVELMGGICREKRFLLIRSL